jgi:hydroxypyruvate isomerase
MPKFAANLTMLYTDSPFLELFARQRIGLAFPCTALTASSSWI